MQTYDSLIDTRTIIIE